MSLKSLLITGGVVIVIAAAIVVGVREAEKHVNSSALNAITEIGSAATGETVTLGSFDVDIFTGHGSITALIVPNSDIGSSKTSFSVASADIRITPWSILWGPLHIKSIEITAPQIDLETSATSSNLTVILIAAGAYAISAANENGGEKKLRVDNLTITNAKLSGKVYPFSTTFSTTMPTIQMKDLGSTGDGLTPGDLVNQVLTQVVNQATTAALHP
ncbi:MAG: hypothetical protein COB93_07135 [Sneathiella sp.]|nr:MAG: hypothetical protein COB93_07135 [Sneathiella sp.]